MKTPEGTISCLKAPTDLLAWWPKDDIQHIEELLSIRLSDDPAALFDQLADLSSWQGRCGALLADAESLLDYAEQRALMSRQEDWTDLDRKVNLKASTRSERRARNILASFSESLKNKIISGMSLKKALTNEAFTGKVVEG